MKSILKKITFVLFFAFGAVFYAQENPESENDAAQELPSQPAQEEARPQAQTQPRRRQEKENSFVDNFTSLRGHRFLEVRGALPFFPTATTHGMVQSFVIGFSDTIGSIFGGGDDFDSTVPKIASDFNLTIFPPIGTYRWGFMLGAAIDKWEGRRSVSGKKLEEEINMNYYYVGAHFDYGHWVFNDLGTRLSIYGELSMGWMNYSVDNDDPSHTFCFDVCPFGIQFCPEKHVGIYFEFPHFGARPFFQTGVSIGL